MARKSRAEYERARRAADPEKFRAMSRASYAKHAEKRRAEKKAEYAADPEKFRQRNKIRYEKNKEDNVFYAREYRKNNREVVNQKAKEAYHAKRDARIARRRIYYRENYAKIYASIQEWRKRNPEKELRYHAKRLINEQTGLPIRDIPDDITEAKIVQLLITRWVREQGLEDDA